MAHRPPHRLLPNNRGWVNFVLEGDNRTIFRFPKSRGGGAALGVEVAVLRYLAPRLSAAIPGPVRVGRLPPPWKRPFLAYPKLAGRPASTLASMNSVARTRLEEFVERILADLAAMPVGPFRRMGVRPATNSDWERKYRNLLYSLHRIPRARLPPRLRGSIDLDFSRFWEDLRKAPFRPVASHLDFGPHHILWDRRADRPVGIIDWGDFCLADPAFDLTAWGDVDPMRHAAWVRSRTSARDGTFERRLGFYRRSWAIHGLLGSWVLKDSALFRTYIGFLRRAYEA